jgi:hypothetical protein
MALQATDHWRTMIWPTPSRGEHVVLTCGCHATVLWRLSLLFVYRIRLVDKSHRCSRARHVSGKRLFVTLEAIAARTDPERSA